jgi:hypothetical protein
MSRKGALLQPLTSGRRPFPPLGKTPVTRQTALVLGPWTFGNMPAVRQSGAQSINIYPSIHQSTSTCHCRSFHSRPTSVPACPFEVYSGAVCSGYSMLKILRGLPGRNTSVVFRAKEPRFIAHFCAYSRVIVHIRSLHRNFFQTFISRKTPQHHRASYLKNSSSFDPHSFQLTLHASRTLSRIPSQG